MAFMKCLFDVIVILIVQTYKFQVAFGESDDVYYIAQFNDKITDCEDYVNDIFLCENMNIVFVCDNDGSNDGFRISGELNLKEEITDDMMIDLMIFKDTPVGREFMYNVGGNICDSLKEEDTPWHPIVNVLNATECPIKPGIYDLNNLVISLNFAKDVLRHELCGDYIIELEFQSGLEQRISCHNVPVEVIEKSY